MPLDDKVTIVDDPNKQQLKFVQHTGKLYDSNMLIGLAYSGKGNGLNNPKFEGIKDIGPIPVGSYTGCKIDNKPEKGPTVFALYPKVTNDMKGRSGFLIHWDNPLHNFSASEGCIIPVIAATFYRINREFNLLVIADEE